MMRKSQREKKPVPPENAYQGGIRLSRIWYLNSDGKRLTAITKSWCWEPGVNQCDELPDLASSRSGFYGFNTVEQMRIQERWGVPDGGGGNTVIGGTFIAWGRIVTAEMGARVEFARIESIIEPSGMDDKYLTILPTVAEHYGIRVITEDMAKELRMGIVPYVEDMKL